MIADDALQSNNQFITGCEHDVFSGLLVGSSKKEIARNLGISRNTVKLHIRNICLALNARSRTHAVAVALRERIIE